MSANATGLQCRQSLDTIQAAVNFVRQDRDYLVGGLSGLGTQQVTTAIAEILSRLLSSLDHIETRLHQSLQFPIEDAKRDLQLAYYCARTGNMDTLARDLEAARTNFINACQRYEDHLFLRVLCLCAAGILRSLQGDRYGMDCSFREAFGELEAFRFLKVSAALSRLELADREDRFVRADLQRQAAAKVDAIEIAEWGVTIAELRGVLQDASQSSKADIANARNGVLTAAELNFEPVSLFGAS